MATETKSHTLSDTGCRRVFAVFRPIFCLLAWAFYGIHQASKRYDEPVLILSNHTTDMDFVVVSACIRNHMYFVCSQHVLGMGLFGQLFKQLFNPIGVFKGAAKPAEVKEMVRRVRRGNSILLFVEGRISHNGRTLQIDPSAAKLAKLLKCRLVTFRTEGGYFKQPRWQGYLNRGKLFRAGIVHEYAAEEVAAMPAGELLAHIREDLDVDAYALQRVYHHRFPLVHGVRDITRYYDVCPCCRGVDTLHAAGDRVICSCGYSMQYDEYGYFHGSPQLVATTQEWERLQLETYHAHFAAGDFFSDPDTELVETTEMFRKTPVLRGTLEGRADGLQIGTYFFPFAELRTPELIGGGAALALTCGGVHYLLQKDGACMNKYLELYLWAKERADTGLRAAADGS